jgi:two-component system sensor histidine kinase LytS
MDKAFRLVSSFLTNQSWALHLLFWAVFLGFFGLGHDFQKDGLQSFLLVCFSYLITGYGSYLTYKSAKKLNLIWLIPIGILTSASLGAYIQYLVMVATYQQVTWLNFFPISMFIGVLLVALKFAKDLHVHLQYEQELKSAQLKMELEQLRTQVSPHFLFNTLNNLYGLAVEKSDGLPDMMIRLSDLLRYSIYEAKRSIVPLQNELDYLSNYISLEKIRMGNPDAVTFSFPTRPVPQNITIGPLLLITFVENAFKHSRNTAHRQINGSVDWDGSTLKFHLSNSFSENASSETGGFGLENTNKRLQLLYLSKHKLTTRKADGKYIVELEIDLI